MIEKIRQVINDRFGDALIKEDEFRGDHSFTIKPEALFPVCEALYNDDKLDIKFLADITAVDWLGHPEEENGRFELVYNLYSISNSFRFFLKVRLPETSPNIRSLVDLWAGANWMEREVWDLFGITFEGHPELTKILTPDDLEGHPLRHDYPLTYEEPRFTWNKDKPPEVIK